jgi:hypothetical protein
VQGLIAPSPDGYRTHSTRDCLVALSAAIPDGGAVITEVLSQVAGAPERPPAAPDQPRAVPSADAAVFRRELDTIHASRGWWLLQRVYRVLHVLKGRGLRR